MTDTRPLPFQINERIERMLGSKDLQIIALMVGMEELQGKYNDLLNHHGQLQEKCAQLEKQLAEE